MPEPLSPPASAPLWRRLAAMLYDSFVVFAIWIMVGFVVLSAFGIDEAVTVEGEQVALDPLYRSVLFGAMLLSSFAFFSIFWMKSGQTLGMQAWKIRVQNADGSPVSLKQSLIRCALAPVSMAALGAGYLWMLMDPEKKAWHDKVSGSEVVRVKL